MNYRMGRRQRFQNEYLKLKKKARLTRKKLKIKSLTCEPLDLGKYEAMEQANDILDLENYEK